MAKWMSFAEAVARAGSFEALRPHLFAGRIIARYSRLCFWPGGEVDNTLPTTDIDPSWWADDVAHDIEPEAGRAQFITDLGNQLARGIELERAAVEALWPVKPKPPLARKKSKGKKGTSAAGTKESPLWKAKIVPHLKTLFPGKPYPTKNESFHAAKDWLFDNEKTLSDSAIREGIKRHFPKWFPDDDD
jgi:hypothetical protein